MCAGGPCVLYEFMTPKRALSMGYACVQGVVSVLQLRGCSRPTTACDDAAARCSVQRFWYDAGVVNAAAV